MNNLKTNERKIKLTGVANIEKPLTLGNDYDLTISNVECSSVKEIPNQDETKNKIYNLKISERSVVNIISEKEVIVAKKKKGSQSQVLRMVITENWNNELSGDINLEDYYQNRMAEIIKNEKNLF